MTMATLPFTASALEVQIVGSFSSGYDAFSSGIAPRSVVLPSANGASVEAVANPMINSMLKNPLAEKTCSATECPPNLPKSAKTAPNIAARPFTISGILYLALNPNNSAMFIDAKSSTSSLAFPSAPAGAAALPIGADISASITPALFTLDAYIFPNLSVTVISSPFDSIVYTLPSMFRVVFPSKLFFRFGAVTAIGFHAASARAATDRLDILALDARFPARDDRMGVIVTERSFVSERAGVIIAQEPSRRARE